MYAFKYIKNKACFAILMLQAGWGNTLFKYKEGFVLRVVDASIGEH